MPINNFYGSIYCTNTTIKDVEFRPTLANKNQSFRQDISKIPLTRLEYTNDTLLDYDPVNENFDYLNLQFSDTVLFNPVEMRNFEIDTYSPTNYTLHIENVLEKESIKISNIFTNCPFIFIEKTKSSTIKPSEIFSFTFSILCSREGHFSGIIFVVSDHGTFPYYIDFICNLVPVIHTESQHIYQEINQPFTFRLNYTGTIETSLIYDSSIFDPSQTTVSFTSILLHPNQLKFGTYLTFLFIKSYTFTCIVPIYLHIVDHSMIIFGDFFFGSGYPDLQYVKVINLENNTLNVTSIQSFESKLIVNLTDWKNNLVPPFSTRTVAYVALGALKNSSWNHIKSGIEMEYALTINNIQYNKTVIFRKFGGIAKCAYYTPHGNDLTTVAHISISNLHPDPLMILSATVESQYFSVKEFFPQVVGHKNYSEEFFITLNKNFDILEQQLYLIVQTNASRHKFPIIRRPMPIEITSNTLNVSIDSHTNSIKFDSIFNMSSRTLSFRVKNNNHARIFLKNVSTRFPCILVERIDPYSDGAIEPFQTLIVWVRITFVAFCNTNTTFTFNFEHKNVSIGLLYNLLAGTMKLDIALRKNFIIGADYEGYITVKSEFADKLRILDIQANYPQVIPHKMPLVITNYTKFVIATYNISLDENFPLTAGFFNILRESDTFETQKKRWKELWTGNFVFPIEIKLRLENGFYFIATMDRNISHAAFPQGIIDFGTIHADEIFCKSINLHNPFTRPIVFTLHDIVNETNPKFNIKHRKIISIDSHETKEFMLTFEGTVPGKYNLEIPVTTNCTPPFTIIILANVEYPRVRFSNEDHNMVTSIEFIVGDDQQYMLNKWTKCVYVTNNAFSPISMNNLYITPNMFISFRANKTSLQPYQTTSVCFDFSLWLFDSDKTEGNISFTVLAQHYLYTLPIYVKISDKAVKQVNEAVNKTMKVISTIGLMSPFVSLLIRITVFVWFRKDMKWRERRVQRAAKHYSVKEYTTAEVQKDDLTSNPKTQEERSS
ncbi:RW1 protein-like protein family [Trichomonas vaginalis G3]|uniref:RW1 protein-like protein family n=1 Tax=Trichomonas vaginalis (strain ATCC PRA-98 / G3) TaxID=412133 RepID=UPI0021E54D6B|nr:RW1 protein-like protein family [Trichomonas vaginalis G3]KAI5509866.1 RW1 protein-like protein family [Trichomonas vaginalis G3]